MTAASSYAPASNERPRTRAHWLIPGSALTYLQGRRPVPRQRATDPYDREHVSPYIHKDPVRFPRVALVPSVPLTGVSPSIDTPEDLARNDRLLDRLQAVGEPPYRLHHILATGARMGETSP